MYRYTHNDTFTAWPKQVNTMSVKCGLTLPVCRTCKSHIRYYHQLTKCQGSKVKHKASLKHGGTQWWIQGRGKNSKLTYNVSVHTYVNTCTCIYMHVSPITPHCFCAVSQIITGLWRPSKNWIAYLLTNWWRSRNELQLLVIYPHPHRLVWFTMNIIIIYDWLSDILCVYTFQHQFCFWFQETVIPQV